MNLKNIFGKKKADSYYGSAQNANGTETSIVLNGNAHFFVKEAYKALRTNIVFSLPFDECKKIAVTSALAGEGKSTNCLNLAISFAQMGAKTLIIDADLRRPNISKLLGQKASPGLSNVLVGLTNAEGVINSTEYPNLDAVFSGDIPPNPTELLISEKMNETIEKLALKYDYIFIDCPPVNVVTDASIISKYVSGVILVVRQGDTTKDDVLEAKKQLDFSGAKLIGTILNDASDINSKYGYNKKHYKYSKYRRKNKYSGEYDYEYGYGYGEEPQKSETKEKKDKSSSKEKKK